MSNEETNNNPNDKPEKQTPDIRYVPIEYLQAVDDHGDRIDLIELIKDIWDGRWLIVKTVVVFIVLGLFVALFTPEEFTSHVVLIPESQQSSSLGGLGGLARQFGVSAAQETNEGIPTRLYPNITQSNIFVKRLLDYEVIVPGTTEKATLYEYLNEHQQSSVLGVIQKYTIRLPFTIRGWFRRDNNTEVTAMDGMLADEEKMQRIIQMSRDEWLTLRELRDRISSVSDRDAGTLTVSVNMPDAFLAADVADRVVQLLSEYITEYRTEKSRKNTDFIEQRYVEARDQFEAAQNELARFNDQNRGQLTAMARTQEQLLQSRYNLTFNLYNSMAERLEEARIKLQEETPVINIMEPAAVPERRSQPRRLNILIFYTFLGGFLGVCLVFGVNFWEKNRSKFQ